MIAHNLVALPVVLPLLAAAVAVLLPPGRKPWLLATGIAWLVFAASLALALRALGGEGPQLPDGRLGTAMGASNTASMPPTRCSWC